MWHELKERDGFELRYLPGVRILNQQTQKQCLVRIAATFYCDLDAVWTEADQNEPGEGPEPTEFDFQTVDDDTCEVRDH